MSNFPKISVLLPVRDGITTLDACLRSVIRQRGIDWELIAIDDGSSDGSRERLLQAAASDSRIEVLLQGREGIVPALNRGLSACRGQAIARMDADDFMHRDRLRLQWETLQSSPELDLIGTHVRCFPRRDLTDGMRKYELWLNGPGDPDRVSRDSLIECPIAHPTLMARGDLLRRMGYRDRGWPEDYDLVLRALGAGKKIGIVPRRLLGWRDGAGRLQRTHPNYSIAQFTACKAAFLADGFLAAGDRYVLWGHGGTGRAIKRALGEQGRFPIAIVEVHPRRLGNRADGVPFIPASTLPEYREFPVVVSVAGATARAEIRQAMAELGFIEGSGFVCVA